MKFITLVVLAALCAVAAAHGVGSTPRSLLGYAPKGYYSKANIVETWSDCPIKKPLEWDPKVFDASLEALTSLSNLDVSVPQKCKNALMALSTCASDSDPLSDPPVTSTSISTTNGCCLTECANSMKSAITLGCFDLLLKNLCHDSRALKFKAGLLNAGMRCAGYSPACPAKAAAAITKQAPKATAPHKKP